MRTCHSKLLPLASLLLIALAEMPASAFYNPNTGRWLNRDPIGENGGHNLHCIAANNPVGKHDLLGLSTCDCRVEDIGLADIQPYSDADSLTLNEGHKFRVVIKLTYSTGGSIGRDCKLKWIETWDTTGWAPGHHRIVPGEPFDNNANDPGNIYLKPWRDRRKLCCSHEEVSIWDYPTIPIGRPGPDYWARAERNILFEIVVEDGDGLGGKSLSFNQSLLFINGREVERYLP